LRHHPRVAAAATLGAVDDQRSRSERHAGQAAGGDVDIGPGEDERAEVLMRAPKLAAVEDRLDRQRHDRLGDERAPAGPDAMPETVAFLLRRGRADQHLVVAGAIERLHYELVEMLEHEA